MVIITMPPWIPWSNSSYWPNNSSSNSKLTILLNQTSGTTTFPCSASWWIICQVMAHLNLMVSTAEVTFFLRIIRVVSQDSKCSRVLSRQTTLEVLPQLTTSRTQTLPHKPWHHLRASLRLNFWALKDPNRWTLSNISTNWLNNNSNNSKLDSYPQAGSRESEDLMMTAILSQDEKFRRYPSNYCDQIIFKDIRLIIIRQATFHPQFTIPTNGLPVLWSELSNTLIESELIT